MTRDTSHASMAPCVEAALQFAPVPDVQGPLEQYVKPPEFDMRVHAPTHSNSAVCSAIRSVITAPASRASRSNVPTAATTKTATSRVVSAAAAATAAARDGARLGRRRRANTRARTRGDRRRAVAAAYTPCVGRVPLLRLSLTEPLAAKLTDRRVAKLLECAGRNLRHVEIHGAPAAFTGRGLFSRMLTDEENRRGGPLNQLPLLRLQTLDVSRCVGVTSKNVLCFLTRSKVHRRPHEERLKKLGLAGCQIFFTDIPQLDEYVRHERCSSRALEWFDYWGCDLCGEVVGFQCEGCKLELCKDCARLYPGRGFTCDHCEDYWCTDCAHPGDECDCGRVMCDTSEGCSSYDHSSGGYTDTDTDTEI